MQTPLSVPRLLAAMILAAIAAALALTLALHFAAQGSDLQLPSLAQVVGMSAFFSLFTLPVAAVFALPAGWLWQRFGPIPPLRCALIGAGCGVVGGGALLMLTVAPPLRWEAALWFAAGGAAAGLAMGRVMGGERTADRASAASIVA